MEGGRVHKDRGGEGLSPFLPSDGTRFGGASADAAESYRAGTRRDMLLP